MSAARDPTSRLRAGLNPLLTTSLGVYHNQAGTPLSAVSMNSHSAISAGPTPPLSAIQPYNPQQWVGSPVVGPGERGHSFPPPDQPSPPPPPPYSPPRSQRPISMAFESSSPANISAARAPAPYIQRPSPEPTVQTFAPPPGQSRRGASRDRRFGLPSFGRRRDTEHATTPPDSHTSAPHPILPVAPTSITSSRPSPAHLTLQIPQTRPQHILNEPSSATNVAPGSRRAASTGAIDTPVSARSRSALQTPWEPGMPIPPPPPGPPPPGSRSQSVSRTSSGSESIRSPPTRRPRPTTLGPIPPTPAEWNDNDDNSNGSNQQRNRTPSPAVSAGTEGPASAGSPQDTPATSAGSPDGPSRLARTGAVRGEKTLRERRNESRTRSIRASIDGSLDTERFPDIIIPPTGSLTRRLTINRSSASSSGPSSRDSSHLESPRQESPEGHEGSRNTTPRPSASSQVPGSHPATPTPPFTPHPSSTKVHSAAQGSSSSSNVGGGGGGGSSSGPSQVVPVALPTPPPQSGPSSASHFALVPPPRSPSRTVTKEAVIKQSAEQFCAGTIERFQAFAQKESAVSTDAERVRLFAEFIVSESRIRRERYCSAIGAMGSEIFDLTRDLFRPMSTQRRESTTSQMSNIEFTPQSSEPSRSHRGSIGSASRDAQQHQQHQQQQQQPPSAPNSAPPSAGMPMSPTAPPPGGWQQQNFMPSLSPILSMSVSDNHDADSRGRPASRWWETDSNGDTAGRLERSKRESKYMGVPKEAREALQWVDTPSSIPSSSRREPSNEYPAEKGGGEQATTPQPLSGFRHSLIASVSSPNTPSIHHLDVSRLVTLPPPYPRHHPAVNNNHPELAPMRTSVRAISDLSEIEATKARFTQESKAARDEAAESARQRKQSLRSNLQQEIASGNMSYAEAAAIEADSNDAEKGQLKELEKKEFDRFQTAVVMPLNGLLTTRIQTATQLFDELRGRLFVETHEPNPNMPQEEGDEQPELLEKLTLLKWIFEARETLHRAIYDLLSDRNDRYRDMVMTPYRLAGNEEKLAGAQAFFAEDAAKRALAFSEEVLRRTQEFRDVVEESAMRGVEVQLSAFWDIAPPLKRLLDKIPADLQGFNIQIPPAEYGETPSYHAHPMQYLFSLLLHAEKSTYQFIESQTNLLCLLHEVKEAVTTAKAKAMEHEGRDPRRVDEMKVEDASRLNEDLQEKVRVVQDQWTTALGDCIQGVKERTGEWLLETGGWDESLEEGGVGSV